MRLNAWKFSARCAKVSLMCWSASTCCAKGLDLPEVSLVAILDADKEGFSRARQSLIQTAGRTARHLNGEVILYADVLTDSIKEVPRGHRVSPQAPDRLQHRAQHHPREARDAR